MLDTLRRGAQTFVAKILLGVLVLSFAIWGVADVFTGASARAVATVGDTEIDVDTFARVYNQQVQTLSRQIGQPLPPEQAAAFGMPQYVLSQLQAEAALTDTARRMGLGLSDEELATIIANDPNLQVGGRFDRNALSQYLRQQGVSEARFVEERRATEVGGQITAGLLAGLAAPEALVELAYRHTREQRSVDAVVLQPVPPEEIEAPADDVLATYFADHAGEYTAPEYRSLRVLAVTPETLARPEDITEEAARAEYERSLASYGQPERRRVEQILFPTEADAEDAARRIADGSATFEEIGAERSITSLDLMAASEFLDPAVAEAAFGLEENAVSGVVAGRFGPLLVRVTGIEPGVVQPFEEVREEIALRLAADAAQSEILNLHDEIENDRIGGDDLATIAAAYDLQLLDIPAIDSNGLDMAGLPVEGLPADADVLGEAFQSEIGLDADPLAAGRSGYVWYEVTDVVAARDRTLDEVRDGVIDDWKEAESQARLLARAEGLVAEVEAGAELATVAAGEGLTVETTDRFTRGDEVDLLGPDGVAAAFGGPVGHVAEAARPDDGARVVLVVRESTVPAFFAEEAGAIADASTYTDAIEAGLTDQLLSQLTAASGTTVNQTLLQAAIGLSGQ
jgi:peptidyl-prolyl cis-trans isomerase D